MKTKNWKFAKTLKDMPSKSGRYLFMTQVGTFFVGNWDAHERQLCTQTIGFHHDDKDRRVTNGEIYMARWSFKNNGHVFWREPDEPLDFYRIWQRAMRDFEKDAVSGNRGARKG